MTDVITLTGTLSGAVNGPVRGVLATTSTRPPDDRILRSLRLAAAGLSRPEVADRAGYSERTVKGHLSRAVNHYKARNVIHAAVLATLAGHITAGDLS